MSPRPGPRKGFVGVKLPAELDHLLKVLAEAEDVSKSELIRRLIYEALKTRGHGRDVAPPT